MKIRRVLFPMAFTAAIALAISGCASNGSSTEAVDQPGEPPSPVAKPASSEEVSQREALPDFSMTTLDDKEWKLSDYKGKVVLVNFWATWCPPCREEMPDLVAIAKKYQAQGLVVAGITLDEDAKKAVPPFVKKEGIPFTILVPKGTEPVLHHANEGIPTTLILDREGRIVSSTLGMISAKETSELIEGLLQEKG